MTTASGNQPLSSLEETFAYEEDLGYVNAFRPLYLYVRDCVNAFCEESEHVRISPHAVTQMMDAYRNRMLSIGLKTLVLDMHREREQGHLHGDDAHARWLAYCKKAAKSTHRSALYARYPALVKMLNESAKHFIDFIEEFVQRLNESADELSVFIGADAPLQVDDVALDGGDAHGHGRSVILVTLNGVRLAYKPRDLAVHAMFNDFVTTCAEHSGFLEMNPTKILCHDGYAFEEFVRHEDCADQEEVRRYYQRFGQLLGVVWFLRGNDMHFENIIASGEYPQIVDYETIITGRVRLKRLNRNADSLARDLLQRSLAATALLPFRMAVDGEGHTVEISALDPNEQKIASAMPVPVDLNTDEARYEHHEGILSKSGSVVRMNGDIVDPYAYGEEILQGFDIAIEAISGLGRERVRQLLEARNMRVRVLLRSTSIYARFLEYAHHPHELDDMRKVENIFDHLREYPFADKRLSDSEYRQMMEGDVPMFTALVDGCAVYDPDGLFVADALPCSPEESVLRTFDTLSEQVELQRRIIRNALHMPVPEHDRATPYRLHHDDAGEYASRIVDDLLRRTITGADEDTLSWIVGKRMEGHGQEVEYAPSLPSRDLYEGLGGLGLLLMETPHPENGEHFAVFEKQCLRSVFSSSAGDGGMSAFTGIASQAYVAMHMRHNDMRLKESERFLRDYLRYLPQNVERLVQELNSGEPLQDTHTLDYLTGACGTIVMQVRLYETLHDPDLLTKIMPLVDAVMSVAQQRWDDIPADDGDVFPSGAAHGMEGMAVAFWRLYCQTGEAKYGAFAHDLWNHAMRRRATQHEHADAKWCRGAFGVLWAQNELESVDGPNHERFFSDGVTSAYPDKAAVERLMATVRWTDDTVCHGRCGAIDTLVSLYNTRRDDWYLRQARELMDGMIAEARTEGRFKLGRVPEFVDLSYFLGPVGVAYTMLRVRHPNIPSILALEVA